MNKHIVKLEDLTAWKQDEKIIFASSTNGNKQLFATLTGGFEVWHNKKLVLETIQPYLAIEKYNSI